MNQGTHCGDHSGEVVGMPRPIETAETVNMEIWVDKA